MERALLSGIMIFSAFLFLPLAHAIDEMVEGPYFESANAAYLNAKHALMSTSIEGIHAFSRLAMDAANNLQAEAAAMRNDTLANFAQGAYNNSKRANMSSSVEQARDYTQQAVMFAQRARGVLIQSVADVRESDARINPNNDMPDSARETYEQGRPRESLTGF